MLKPVEKPIKFVKNLSTKGKSFPITHISAVIDDNGESIKSTIDSLKNKKVTWLELKNKRDAGKLIPGSLYRITDYQCTTTQENTRSAGHQFDIVLLALSENKLAEEGWAMEHPTDVYDVTFTDDGVTKKCYFWIKEIRQNTYYGALVDCNTFMGRENNSFGIYSIDIVNKKITINQRSDIILSTENVQYNYFQYSNLSAWKVWYCLDNDTDRFAWADNTYKSKVSIIYNNVEYFYKGQNGPGQEWENANGESVFTSTKTPSSGDSVYREFYLATVIGTVSEYKEVIDSYNGRGVIYRLIDEFNNDIKYDFKNIQFKHKLTNGLYDANGTETWCYTLNIWYNDMCQDASIVGNTLPNDEGFVTGVYDNKFGYATAFDLYIKIKGVNTFVSALGNNVVLSFNDDGYYGIYSNTIGNGFHNNTIWNNFQNNTIGNYFRNNTIVNTFNSNTIGNNFQDKQISTAFQYTNYGNNGVELATKDDLN